MPHTLYILTFLCMSQITLAQDYYKGSGKVMFVSEAPLEVIRAESEDLNGIIDVSKLSFAFKINMSSFQGFNSALQQEHFNEHYLETENYPNATFTGKIILDEDCTQDCATSAVAKGKFKIHGVNQIVNLPLSYRILDEVIYLTSNFIVLLADYDIKIPRIVHAKISPEIEVNVEIELKQQ